MPSSLPDEVITCLQNARFLHLATCSDNVPHVSLMNYTYLPSTPYCQAPIVIMTTPASSRKTQNLESNPLVSLLVHDWVSHRPPTLTQSRRSPSPSLPASRPGSLAELLLSMNTASLSRISTTINGVAEFVPYGTEEEIWYKSQHLANNTFGPLREDIHHSSSIEPGLWGGGGLSNDATRTINEEDNDSGTKCYVDGAEIRVVIVRVTGGRIADWEGKVRDWTVSSGLSNAQVNGDLEHRNARANS